MVRRSLFTGSIAVVLLAHVVGGQTPSLVFHDFDAMPFLGSGRTQIKAVVTDDGSIGVGETAQGTTQAPHHHEQEQIVLPIAGSLDFSIGGVVHKLTAGSAAIPPSNSEHFYVNTHGGPTQFIEYQPIRRNDWARTTPAYTAVQSPEPRAVPSGRALTRDLSPASDAWMTVPNSNGARTKAFVGETIALQMVDLRASGASFDQSGVAGTSFLFVLDGSAEIESGTATRSIGRNTVVQVPSGVGFRLRALNGAATRVARFSRAY